MPDDLTVALVIGGHPFDVPAALDAFDSLPGLAVYPQDLPSFVADEDAVDTYDAAVFYHFHGNGFGVDLTDEFDQRSREAIPGWGDAGLGMVVLHHGIPAFPDVEAWSEVCGIEDRDVTPHFDQDVPIDVADAGHPITEGLDPWTMRDETYEMPEPEGRVLLSTDHPRSMDALAWTREYRASDVFCYQSGHGPPAFGTPEFRTVLGRGIRWVAGAPVE